ncbi:VOC family protein [Actinomadura keratinilytica]
MGERPHGRAKLSRARVRDAPLLLPHRGRRAALPRLLQRGAGRRGDPGGEPLHGPPRQQLAHHEPRRRRPTPDKPGITLHPPQDSSTATCFLNIRVADIQAVYEEWSAKGAEFVTPPIDRKAEIRCYLRDPDGYLIEIGQATGMLHGVYADPPAGKGPGTR